jgi:DNA uptake protein ComE-like DNA-binding protein
MQTVKKVLSVVIALTLIIGAASTADANRLSRAKVRADLSKKVRKVRSKLGAVKAVFNLNTASAGEIAKHAGVTPQQAAQIVKTRDKKGAFKDWESVLAIDHRSHGVGVATLAKLMGSAELGPVAKPQPQKSNIWQPVGAGKLWVVKGRLWLPSHAGKLVTVEGDVRTARFEVKAAR